MHTRYSIIAALAPLFATGVGSKVLPVEAPAGAPARYPRLSASVAGAVLASWTESREDGVYALCFARFEDGAFGEPIEVARGADWFVNGADFPSVVAGDDQAIAAHWLQRLGKGTYAYGVRIACSTNGGESFEPPFWLHEDRSATEHGFATLLPLTAGRFGGLWLDGRDLPAGKGMGLRWVEFDANGATGEETLLDERVCECCATEAAQVGGRTIAVYRDRSLQEVRDISLVRRDDAGWSEGTSGCADGWVNPG
jgi:hypothetical protein